MTLKTHYRAFGLDGRWHRGDLIIDTDGYFIEEYGTVYQVDKTTVEEINF